jgi:hypothetical protein
MGVELDADGILSAIFTQRSMLNQASLFLWSALWPWCMLREDLISGVENATEDDLRLLEWGVLFLDQCKECGWFKKKRWFA